MYGISNTLSQVPQGLTKTSRFSAAGWACTNSVRNQWPFGAPQALATGRSPDHREIG